MIPRAAVADTDVQQIELRVVRHRIPYRSAAAVLPPFAAPGLRGLLQCRALESVGGVAGDGVEPPHLLARRRIVRRDKTAHAHLTAAVADDDVALDDARRASDGVALRRIRGLYAPHNLACRHVERDQAAVECSQVDIVAPRRDA